MPRYRANVFCVSSARPHRSPGYDGYVIGLFIIKSAPFRQRISRRNYTRPVHDVLETSSSHRKTRPRRFQMINWEYFYFDAIINVRRVLRIVMPCPRRRSARTASDSLLLLRNFCCRYPFERPTARSFSTWYSSCSKNTLILPGKSYAINVKYDRRRLDFKTKKVWTFQANGGRAVIILTGKTTKGVCFYYHTSKSVKYVFLQRNMFLRYYNSCSSNQWRTSYILKIWAMEFTEGQPTYTYEFFIHIQ